MGRFLELLKSSNRQRIENLEVRVDALTRDWSALVEYRDAAEKSLRDIHKEHHDQASKLLEIEARVGDQLRSSDLGRMRQKLANALGLSFED